MVSFFKKISRNAKISLGILCIVVIWMASGMFKGEPQPKTVADTKVAVQIQTKKSVAQAYIPSLDISGRVESTKSVIIESQVDGIVENIFVKSGDYVKKGAVLVKLSGSDSGAKLEQAQVSYIAAKLKFAADTELYRKKLLSKVGFQKAKAEYKLARSALEIARQMNAYYYIRAPFTGRIGVVRIFKNRLIKRSTKLLDISGVEKYIFTAYVSSRQVKRLSIGNTFTGRTSLGKFLVGNISGISSIPEDITKTYRIEGTLKTKNFTSGESAAIQIALGRVKAHKISSSLLTINDEGDVGVKVAENGIVMFKPVSILNENLQDMWVSGLPDTVILLTSGAGFAKIGDPLNK